MKIIRFILVLFALSVQAQYKVKVKKEDNCFLFFQVGNKCDTIVKNKNDIFLMKLPDSLKQNINVFITNGQLVQIKKDSLYKLMNVPGMKYSHSTPNALFNTLLEGNCTDSKNITVEFINTKTQQCFLKNKFTYN